jgi:hypothetical protein
MKGKGTEGILTTMFDQLTMVINTTRGNTVHAESLKFIRFFIKFLLNNFTNHIYISVFGLVSFLREVPASWSVA